MFQMAGTHLSSVARQHTLPTSATSVRRLVAVIGALHPKPCSAKVLYSRLVVGLYGL